MTLSLEAWGSNEVAQVLYISNWRRAGGEFYRYVGACAGPQGGCGELGADIVKPTLVA